MPLAAAVWNASRIAGAVNSQQSFPASGSHPPGMTWPKASLKRNRTSVVVILLLAVCGVASRV
jgi:hypothetical protein